MTSIAAEKEAYPEHPVFEKNTIEFITVAAEYCAFIESCRRYAPKSFFDKSVKILSLLYLKASLMPKMEDSSFSDLQQFVTEATYENIRSGVARLTAEHDEYLDVRIEEDGQSTDEYLAFISEDLADIYQDLKDMLVNFQSANLNIMNDALLDCMDNFASFWGGKLLNALKAMHSVLHSGDLMEYAEDQRMYGEGYDEIEDGSNNVEIDFFND